MKLTTTSTLPIIILSVADHVMLGAAHCIDFYTTIATQNGPSLAYVERINSGVTEELGVITEFGTWSLGYDFGNGTMYGLKTRGADDRSKLAKIDTETGETVVVGETGTLSGIGLAITKDGFMYSHGQDDGYLYQLDKTTGRAYVRGYTGIPNVIDMTYGFEEGAIYAADNDNNIYTINPVNGESTRKGEVTGMLDGQRIAGLSASPSNKRLYVIAGDETNASIYVVSPNMQAELKVQSSLTGSPNSGALVCGGDHLC